MSVLIGGNIYIYKYIAIYKYMYKIFNIKIENLKILWLLDTGFDK